MRTVTKVLNDAHLANSSTLGAPGGIQLFGNPLTPSINFSSAYQFNSIENLGNYHENKFNSMRYTRDSSLLVRQLEQYFELIHDGYRSLLFNTGMSAVAAAINTLSHNNIKIVTFGSYYRKTYSIIKNLKDKFGIIHEHYDSSNDYLKGDAGDEGTIFFVESPSNPFLRLIDIKKIRNKVPESKIILDTTFQGLLNDKGFIQYADLIVVSCTKYIGGHNDLFGGIVACANDELYSRIWDERSMKGGIIDNMSAYLLLRSLRTYDLRIERSLENVKYILEFLENDKAIKKIYYPGAFENSDQSELFTKMHYHGGAVVTFEMNHNINLKKNISNLFSTKMAPSFGSVDSLIEIPIYMSHWGQSKEFVKSLKLNEYSVRLSVGNEPVEYIINDLKRLIAK